MPSDTALEQSAAETALSAAENELTFARKRLAIARVNSGTMARIDRPPESGAIEEVRKVADQIVKKLGLNSEAYAEFISWTADRSLHRSLSGYVQWLDAVKRRFPKVDLVVFSDGDPQV